MVNALAVSPWKSGRKLQLSTLLSVDGAKGEVGCVCEGNEVGRGGNGDGGEAVMITFIAAWGGSCRACTARQRGVEVEMP